MSGSDEKVRVVSIVSKSKHPELYDLLAGEERYYRSRKLLALATQLLQGDETPLKPVKPKRTMKTSEGAQGRSRQRKGSAPSTSGQALDIVAPLDTAAQVAAPEPPAEETVGDMDRRKELAEAIKRSMSF